MTKVYFQVGAVLLVMMTNRFLSRSKKWMELLELPEEQSLPYRDLIQSFRPSNNLNGTTLGLGPKNLAKLPQHVRKKFLEFNMGDRIVKGRTLRGGITYGQVHEIARPFLQYNGFQKGWSNQWSYQLVETMIKAVKEGKDISCPDYPGSAWQVQTALDRLVPLLREQQQNDNNHNSSPLKILIAGSISPWLEAIVLAHPEFSSLLENNRIITTDYNPLQIDHPSIHFVSVEELKTSAKSPNFDLILSFSSIEHDGLGRYGDPINPRGDIAAMAEYHTMLRPQAQGGGGGFLMLAVPTVLKDNMKGMIKANNARIYSLERLQQALWCGFDIVGGGGEQRIDPPSMMRMHTTPDNTTTGVRQRPPPSSSSLKKKEDDPVGYQPIFLLQKKKTTTGSSSCYQQMLP